MMEGSICIDGEIMPAAQARISVFDRGFLYGDSAFEVMRTYGARPFREQAHLARLRASCERLLIALANALLGLPPVVVGLFVYLLLTRSGPMGSLGWPPTWYRA